MSEDKHYINATTRNNNNNNNDHSNQNNNNNDGEDHYSQHNHHYKNNNNNERHSNGTSRGHTRRNVSELVNNRVNIKIIKIKILTLHDNWMIFLFNKTTIMLLGGGSKKIKRSRQSRIRRNSIRLADQQKHIFLNTHLNYFV